MERAFPWAHPQQLNGTDWREPSVSPKARPDQQGRSQGTGTWPAAESWPVGQISFVLRYYANKQIKLSTWDFFLIKGFD